MATVLVNNERGNKVTEIISFTMEECFKCAIPFFIPTYYQKRLIASHETFYCPNGHGQCYTGKSEQQKKIEELEAKLLREKQYTQNATDELCSQINKTKDLNRQLKRVHKGVCPCCNRSFENLKRHMETKHPLANKI